MSKLSLFGAGCGAALFSVGVLGVLPAAGKPRALEWADLIPSAAQQSVVKGVVAHEDIAALETAEGRAAAEQASAPLRGDLDGQEVRMGGYVVPLTFKGMAVVDFLLVPFVGACVHVPAPPANQIVYIHYAKGIDFGLLTASVWVTGPLKASLVTTDLAAVGYRIEAAAVDPGDF